MELERFVVDTEWGAQRETWTAKIEKREEAQYWMDWDIRNSEI